MTEQTPRGQRWKTSQFNEYLGELRENNWVVYNNLSGAMIEVQRELYDSIRNNDVGYLPKPGYYNALSHGKFIIAGNIDEVEEIKRLKEKAIESVDVIGLQILPTLGCNFNCTYCFEQAQYKRESMSPGVMEAIIAHVSKKIKPTTRYLNVMWFGGEPLLAVKCIRYLGRALPELARQNNIRYFAGIVTNGFLLSEKNVDMLLQYGVNSCQVTIDGPESIHDRRRRLRNGGKTWQTIVGNLKIALSKGMGIGVRVNLDKTNIDSIGPLLKELEAHGILNRVKVSFGLVSAFGNVCRSIEHTLLTLPGADAILQRERISDLLKKPGEEVQRPVPDFIGCVATAGNSVIVGPSGELYKCSKSIGNEREQCGTIFDLEEEHPNFKKWLECGNLDLGACNDCSMLPVCRGQGCAFKYVIEKKNIFDCNRSVHHERYLNKLVTLYKQKH